MTLLVKGVRILGGEGTFPERADVFVNGDKISAIGSFPAKKADEVIDGQGAYLAPGFIDVNTDSDHYLSLLEYPEQEDFLRQGVTTIVGGQCGSSLAPLLYGSLESIEHWSDTSRFNVDWHTMYEFLSTLDRRPPAVNFATLVGHSTIRRAIVGDGLRTLTKSELTVFGEVLRRALREGGFGLSTGLGYLLSRETPYAELEYFARIVKEFDGVYATHLRKGGAELSVSVEETMKLARETGVKTQVSHFVPFEGSEDAYERALEEIAELPSDSGFHFDLYPFSTSVLALYTFLPLWAQSGGMEGMVRNVHDEWLQPRILKELPKVRPVDFVIAQAPENEALVGRSLRDFAEMYSLRDERRALMKLMMTTGLKANIFYKNINRDLTLRALAHPRALIASNAASFRETGKKALKPERAISTFPTFLKLVEEKHLMTLEDAVRRVTAVPAKKFGLAGRGVLKEGNFADLTGLKDGEIKFVVVNGQCVVKGGVFQGKCPGRALRHSK